jgi:hypothetical protein
MQSSTLTLSRASVVSELVTQDEFNALLSELTSLLPVEARARCRNVSLLPVTVCSAAAQAYGRCAQTVELLQALSALPHIWELEQERDADAEAGEVDLNLVQQIEDEMIDEDLDLSLAAELVIEYAPFQSEEADDNRVLKLNPVPPAIKLQLEGYEKFRCTTHAVWWLERLRPIARRFPCPTYTLTRPTLRAAPQRSIATAPVLPS